MPERADLDPAGLDLKSAGIGALTAAVTARRVSALELCDAAIARIERLDPALNAVVVRDFERARAQARAADAALARGEPAPPLAGVPMTVKESYNVAGLKTTWGLAPFKDVTAEQDAVLVARLKAAGAVILGKTNVPPALGDWQSVNPIYGRTRHPYDPARTPGGSSGGGAAAVAAGMVPIELGSDIGGSIRVPAHFCGICGHKPSFGLLSTRGHSMPGTDGAPVDFAVCGPLARSVEDLERLFEILAGPDGEEAASWRLQMAPPRRTELAGCRAVLLERHPSAPLETAIASAFDRLAGDLERAGARVQRAGAPGAPPMPDLALAHRTYATMLATIVTRRTSGAQPLPVSAYQWLDLVDQRARTRRQWRAFFDEADVLLAAPFGTVAFEHIDEAQYAKRTLTVDGESTPYANQLAWSGLASFTGLPSTVVPIARNAAGLPIGVQVIGPYFEDRTALAVAGRIAALSSS